MAISEALIDFGEDDNIGEDVLDDGASRHSYSFSRSVERLADADASSLYHSSQPETRSAHSSPRSRAT